MQAERSHHGITVMDRPALEAVLEIERLSFERPWPREVFMALMMNQKAVTMVVEARDEVVGFMTYKLGKRHLSLLNIAVHPECRRKGYGSRLLDRLYAKLRPDDPDPDRRRKRLVTQVSERLLGAHLWFAANGWKAVEVRRGAGEEGEDTYVFVRAASPDGNRRREGRE